MRQSKKKITEKLEGGKGFREKRLAVIVVSFQAIQFPVDGSGFILSSETRTGEGGRGMEGGKEGRRSIEGGKSKMGKRRQWGRRGEGDHGEKKVKATWGGETKMVNPEWFGRDFPPPSSVGAEGEVGVTYTTGPQTGKEGRKRSNITESPTPTFIIPWMKTCCASCSFCLNSSSVPSLMLENPGNRQFSSPKLLHDARGRESRRLTKQQYVCCCSGVWTQPNPTSLH